MLNKEYYIAYLCQNMNNFDAVDVIECRSEEAISFFSRSVSIENFFFKSFCQTRYCKEGNDPL